MKKIETSKKILIVSYSVAIVLTLLVIFGTFFNFDASNITTIALLAWGEVSVSNAFYYNKAAKENVPKILKDFDKEILEQIDINQFINQ